MHTSAIRTCAVVVTYNRLPLLCQCVDRLLRQTIPCDMLVVNNASTDGTEEWLVKQAAQHSCVHFHTTEKNLGGAGGFHLGLHMASKMNYDWLWIMDDDCLPEPDALEKLVSADKQLEGRYGWLSSRALWTDGTPCLMNIQRKSPYRDIRHFDERLIPAAMASFVSLFLRTDTVHTYGLPLKEFFIWTDDWEYTRRISRRIPCYVITDSVVIHAMKENKVVDIATDSLERLPRYGYAYRNDVYLYRREGLLGWLWLLMKNSYHTLRLFSFGHPKRVGIIWKGFCLGIGFKIPSEGSENC